MHKIISLFTGAGGMDLGLEAAGFETSVAVEMDDDCVATLKSNRNWPVLHRNVHDVPSEEILEAADLSEGEADLLVGGPPCQPFSKSGYWAEGDSKRLDDPRATTLEAYLRVLRDTKPRAFILENVAGLAYKNKDEGMRLLRETVQSINGETGTNYSFNVRLLNAADFGVPQERKRVFIVGHREDLTFTFPNPTHARIDRGNAHEPDSHKRDDQLGLDLFDLAPPVTAWDAIGDLEENDDPSLAMSGKWAELLPSIPEGCNYLFHTERGGGLPIFDWRSRYWSFMLKLSKAYPSWTIQAQPGSAIGPFHWKNRWLSPQELCRLQTFPDKYEIIGNNRSVQRQLGNAVPSALTEILGLEIRRQLFGESDLDTRSVSLAPEPRRPIPGPEPIEDVPEKYYRLVEDRQLELQEEKSGRPGAS